MHKAVTSYNNLQSFKSSQSYDWAPALTLTDRLTERLSLYLNCKRQSEENNGWQAVGITNMVVIEAQSKPFNSQNQDFQWQTR